MKVSNPIARLFLTRNLTDTKKEKKLFFAHSRIDK